MRDGIARLSGRAFDVVVIGGGVNGASAAQHLAAAGYSVLIVDKGDFASGASSRSSRLLHCGLRYLAPGRSIWDFVRYPSRLRTALRMARLAMEARTDFVRTTPTRVAAIRLHFPIYRDGPYKRWQVDAAFKILKQFEAKDVPLDYQFLTLRDAQRLPLIGGLRDFDRLEGVAAFREYQFHWPERITIDAILDAERLGAVARNYTSAKLASHEAGKGWSVELSDNIQPSSSVVIRGKIVLNMAGIWIDKVLQEANPRAGRKIFGTKGAHILVKLPDACRGLGIATLNSKSEPFYCIPWHQFHYFGPTETAYEGDPDNVFVTGGELAFLLHEANRLLPDLNLTAKDVRLTWAGVRPLTYDEKVPFGNRSRIIHDLSQDGLPDAFAMTAGPVMTHRSAGLELTRKVRQHLSPTRPPQTPHFGAVPEIETGAEHATSLSDVLFRRRGLAWSGPVDEHELTALTDDIGAMLGWDTSRKCAEMRQFQAEWQHWFSPRDSDCVISSDRSHAA